MQIELTQTQTKTERRYEFALADAEPRPAPYVRHREYTPTKLKLIFVATENAEGGYGSATDYVHVWLLGRMSLAVGQQWVEERLRTPEDWPDWVAQAVRQYETADV
jgi:hypothetical protein